MDWAAQELKYADLGDVRRNRRLVKIVEDLSQQPNESVPQAARDLAAVQGVYEFWGNRRIKSSAIIGAHASSTVERIEQHPEEAGGQGAGSRGENIGKSLGHVIILIS